MKRLARLPHAPCRDHSFVLQENAFLSGKRVMEISIAGTAAMRVGAQISHVLLTEILGVQLDNA